MKYFNHFVMVLLIFLLASGVGGSLAAQLDGAAPDISPLPGTRPMTTWITEYIKKGPDFGSHVSITFDEDNGGNPWIAYFDAELGDLRVAHYVGTGDGNCGTANSWHCEVVDEGDGGAIVGQYTSIDVHPDTNPEPLLTTWRVGVSYYDASYHNLKYAKYSCSILSGCSWDIDTVDASVDAADIIGMYSSIKFGSSGIANIAYFEHNDTSLIDFDMVKYAYYVGNNDGDCGDYSNWKCVTVDSSTSDIGRYTSLDIDYSGNVYIAWYNASTDDLEYAYYSGIGDGCSSGEWTCRIIESNDTTDVGRWVSFHAKQNASDKLRAAYYDATNGMLRYAYTSTGGNCGTAGSWQCDAIDEMGDGLVLADISLAVDAKNLPMIAYTDASEALGPAGLKVAVPAAASKYANCGGEILYDWYCKAIENGDANTEVGNYSAVGFKANGLAMIAYSEWDSYNEYYNLKVAFQVFDSVLPLVVKH